MVEYGGSTLAQNVPMTPLGVCDPILHSEASFSDGKILRMGHYAKILLARFRLDRRVDQ
jgi:hypothetical protein